MQEDLRLVLAAAKKETPFAAELNNPHRCDRGTVKYLKYDPSDKLPIELTGPPLHAGVTWVWRAGNLLGLRL